MAERYPEAYAMPFESNGAIPIYRLGAGKLACETPIAPSWRTII